MRLYCALLLTVGWAGAQTPAPTQAVKPPTQLSAAGAAALEESLTSNPDDFGAQLRLINFYSNEVFLGGYDARDSRAKLLKHVEWMAGHHPADRVLDLVMIQLQPADLGGPGSPEWARYKAAWKQAAESHPNDVLVLRHALNAMFVTDLEVPFLCLRHLRGLEPTIPQYPLQLAMEFVRVLEIQTPAERATLKAQLVQSGDPATIGLTGQMYLATADLAKSDADKARYRTDGADLIQHAHALDPENPRWVEAKKTPPAANLNEAIAAMGTLHQRDLWPGGVVKGIVPPPDAVKVNAETQAAKLISPTPAFVKNALATRWGPGEVRLLVIVAPTGQVDKVQFESGPVNMADYAMGMVKGWRYSPTQVNGEAVSVVTHVDLHFTPPNAAPAQGGVVGMSGMTGRGSVGASDAAASAVVLKGASAETVTVGPDVLEALSTARPAIANPSAGSAAPEYGAVTLKVLISKAGKVEEAAFVSGPQALARAAIEGVRAWTYRPFRVNGQAKQVQSEVVVGFPKP